LALSVFIREYINHKTIPEAVEKNYILKKIRWWNKPFLPIIFIFKTIPRALSMRPRISAALKRKYRLEIFIYNQKIARAKKLKKRKVSFARHIALNRFKSTLRKPTTMLFLGLLVFFAGYLVTVTE
jgi:hypothetical protein